MSRIMLVAPWNYHNEKVKTHDLQQEWHNAPYSLLLLGTILLNKGHYVVLADLDRELVNYRGDIKVMLGKFSEAIEMFKPDVIAFSFFSVHLLEVQKALDTARRTCQRHGLNPRFIAGGIHSSVFPLDTALMGFDCVVVGPGENAIVELADRKNAPDIVGGEPISNLDSLPFPDWSLCDYEYYNSPSYARSGRSLMSSLDMMMGRGCVHRCAFCAYRVTSRVQFFSVDYLIEQVKYMIRQFGVTGIYFTDSTVANNVPLLRHWCEKLLSSNIKLEWYANIRADQVNAELLSLMWRAGCRLLLYGFESGSQNVLRNMHKGLSIEDNYRAAELHNQMRFPYIASMIIGYPGETEADMRLTYDFLAKVRPPRVGINKYVPLPGSDDYEKMVKEKKIHIHSPKDWRQVGEIDTKLYYANMPKERFKELTKQIMNLAFVEIPKENRW